MQTAPISGLQSTQQTQATDKSFLLREILGASGVDPNGPFGKWITSAEKGAQWLFAQNLANNQSSGSQFMAAQYPQAYSSDQISPEVQQNPNAYLDGEGDHGSIKCMNFSSDAGVSDVSVDSSSDGSDPVYDQPTDDGGTVAAYSDSYDSYVADQQTSDTGDVSGSWSDDSGNGDGGTISGYSQQYDDYVAANNTDFVGNSTSSDITGYGDGGAINGYQRGDYGLNPRGPMITDPSIESGRQVAANRGNTIIRDHRPLPPAAPPAQAMSTSLAGNGFTSAEEFQRLGDLKAASDAAEAAAIANPSDPQLAQAAQDAREAFQLEQAKASQDSAIAAQHAMDALKASQLRS